MAYQQRGSNYDGGRGGDYGNGGGRDNGSGGGRDNYDGGYNHDRDNYQGGGRGGGDRGGGRGDGAPRETQEVYVDNRRERTKIRDDMELYFQKNNIQEGDPVLEDKMPPGTVSKAKETFHINAFGVSVGKFPLHQYHIEMSAWRNFCTKKPFLFTKRSNDDYVATDRKTRCRDVFTVIKQVRPDIFDPSITFYYDLQSTLMATAKLKPDVTTTNEIKITFDPQQYANYYSLQSFVEVNVDIKQSETDTELTSDDMAMARIMDLTKLDRSHLRFIELATSQHALFHPEDVVCLAGGKMYLMSPEKSMGNVLVERCNAFSGDKFLGIGCKKSVKYIEGPHGRGHENVALFIEPIKTPFFRSITVVEHLLGCDFNLNDRSQYIAMQEALKGLYVFNPSLAGKQTFQITRLVRETGRTMTFKTKEGGTTSVMDYFGEKYGCPSSVMDYFREKYGVRLHYPDLPLVKGKGKTDLLPMECAKIDENQPAPKNKMTQKEDADMIKISAQPPAIQKREVKSFLAALGLNNLVKERDGVEMKTHLTVEGRILQNPEIVYADDKVVVPGDDGLWKLSGKFLRSGRTCLWGLIRYGSAIPVSLKKKFAKKLRKLDNSWRKYWRCPGPD